MCFCLCLIIVNIIGYMHFWDLSLDSVTIIMLIIALGLSVDYAAHIGRAFMEVHGTPDERLRMCLENMGVAVFNGAVSTFLAVLLLSGSQSYVFITFFRQLFLCIVFGSRTSGAAAGAHVHRQPQALRRGRVRTLSRCGARRVVRGHVDVDGIGWVVSYSFLRASRLGETRGDDRVGWV